VLLNRDEIASHNLVADARSEKFRTASYDVSIGEVIGPDGQSNSSLVINPQQMVMVISAEHITLPEDIAGYAMPKTSFSNAGILALSTGIIDPKYEGKVSSILINFGQAPHLLQAGDSFLRLTFHRINKPRNVTPAPSMSDEDYVRDRRDIATRLPDTFLNVSNIVSDVAERVGVRQQISFTDFLSRGTLILAGAALLLAIITFIGAPIVDWAFTDETSEATVEIRQEELQDLEDEVGRLDRRLDELQGQGSAETSKAQAKLNQPVTSGPQAEESD
jgi:dUTPase